MSKEMIATGGKLHKHLGIDEETSKEISKNAWDTCAKLAKENKLTDLTIFEESLQYGVRNEQIYFIQRSYQILIHYALN